MALIEKKKKVNFVSKKVNLEEEVYKQLQDYLEFLGYVEEEEKEAIDSVINQTLKYVFEKDKDYTNFKSKNQNKKENVTVSNAGDENNINL